MNETSQENATNIQAIPAPKNTLQQLVEVPVLGGLLGLFLGLGLPIGGTYLVLYYLWVPEDSPFAKPIAAAVVTIWNLFLAKKMKTVFTLPIIPIPLWIFGLIMAIWSTIKAL